jgi:hypothetical protein
VGLFLASGLADILAGPELGFIHNYEMRFPWIIARLEKGDLAMQGATLIVNTRSRSAEKAF